MIRTLTKVGEKELGEIAEEKRIRRTDEVFVLFSLGSQFDHLIKQMVEKLGLFCIVADPNRVTVEDIRKLAPTGIILSGGPVSVYENPPVFDSGIFDLGIPVLGICLGFQMWAKHIGCTVVGSEKREFGIHELSLTGFSKLFDGCEEMTPVLESHGDRIEERVVGLERLGRTAHAPFAAAKYHHLWGVQFHPEVTETLDGERIFRNFCFGICGAKKPFPAKDAATQKVAELRQTIGKKKVLLALSGGTDSSTLAFLLREALGDRCKEQVRAIYIKGIDRPDDEEHVLKYFSGWMDVVVVDATDRFLARLAGKTGMHEKRVAMRGVYAEVLEEEIKRFGADFIAQGTLYTDISESGGGYDTGAQKAQIKLHHNVGLNFSVPELLPLSDCVKDTGRDIGRAIGVPEELLMRHPFPGPGLIIRIEGEVTAQKLAIARQIDGIWIEELRREKLYETVWQAGAVVTQSVVTCTKGDDGVSGIVVRLWAVWSVNGFTAQAAELPHHFIKRVCRRITNEVREVGSVDYRYSDKPPATVECG